MILLALYPHIYSRQVNSRLLFFNTLNGHYKEYSIKDNFTFEYYLPTLLKLVDTSSPIVEELVASKFGYILSSNTPPVCIESINFTSSREKTLSYKDGSNIFGTITKINIFVDNETIVFDNDLIFSILHFPKKSTNHLSTVDSFLNSKSFPNLVEFELVTEITDRAMNFASSLKKYNKLITIKTICNDIESLEFIISYSLLNEDVFIKSYVPLELLEQQVRLIPKNILFIPYSSNLDEITTSKQSNIFPLLYDKETQTTLIESIKLDKDDILHRIIPLSQIRTSQVVNIQNWGNISIIDKSIYSRTQYISNIEDFSDSFNEWYYRKDNNWFSIRRNLKKCCSCLYADLCPSISIYEEMGIINYPCKLYDKLL